MQFTQADTNRAATLVAGAESVCVMPIRPKGRPPRLYGVGESVSGYQFHPSAYPPSMNPGIIHHLHYSWTGWPAEGSTFIPPDASVFRDLTAFWAKDGFSLVSYTAQPGQFQITCRVEPVVSPAFYAARIKGRLQHALRNLDRPSTFSRKLGVRAVGYAPREAVVKYLANQVISSDLANPGYRSALEEARFEDSSVDLLSPHETDRGRYWYALHLVLITEGRFRLGAQQALPMLCDSVVGKLS